MSTKREAPAGGWGGGSGRGAVTPQPHDTPATPLLSTDDLRAAALALRQASRRQFLAGLLGAAAWCAAQASHLESLEGVTNE